MMFTLVNTNTAAHSPMSSFAAASSVSSLCHFLNVFGMVSFLAATFDKIQFQSQESLSQIN